MFHLIIIIKTSQNSLQVYLNVKGGDLKKGEENLRMAVRRSHLSFNPYLNSGFEYLCRCQLVSPSFCATPKRSKSPTTPTTCGQCVVYHTLWSCYFLQDNWCLQISCNSRTYLRADNLAIVAQPRRMFLSELLKWYSRLMLAFTNCFQYRQRLQNITVAWHLLARASRHTVNQWP